MSEHREAEDEMHAHLGYKRVNVLWGRCEILLGLAAAGIGIFLGQWVMSRPGAAIDWTLAAAALSLFVLGGYLALAGHRSHLYRSLNEQTAYLAEKIRQSIAKGRSS